MPVSNNSATTDVIDHASNVGKSHSEMENHNGGSKKGKQKKTGKSIFYPNSGSTANCNAPSSSSSSSFVSNGFKSSPKADQIDSGSQNTRVTSSSIHGSVAGGK